MTNVFTNDLLIIVQLFIQNRSHNILVKINIHLRKKTDEMIDYILLEFRSKYVEMIQLFHLFLKAVRPLPKPRPRKPAPLPPRKDPLFELSEYLFTFVLNFPPFKKFKNKYY
jgi:hypothetical protein